MQVRQGLAEGAYWLSIALLILVKATLVSDLAVHIAYFPHDDSAYVMRAFHLLRGEAFGPYDSHTLSKLPGISFWLAGVRLFGVPHLLAINALYVGAGLYPRRGPCGWPGTATWCRSSISTESPGPIGTTKARSEFETQMARRTKS